VKRQVDDKWRRWDRDIEETVRTKIHDIFIPEEEERRNEAKAIFGDI
jgi:hypothetical protein